MVRVVAMAGVAAAFLGAGAAWAATETFHATLSPASEVPPVSDNGKGEATVTVDTTTRQAAYNVTFSGLSGPATMAHIHGPAAPDQNGGVEIVLGGKDPTSPITGSATLTASELSDLEAGKMYVNVHTAAHPAGALRGQLSK